MQNISSQFQELKEGKIDRHQFLRNARMMFPAFITNMNSFEDSVKILKNRGLLNEGDAVKGTPEKSPIYDYPNSFNKKYKKVEQSPEVEEQDGIYPATSLTDIPKPEKEKKLSKVSDGLQPLKDKDEKNGMKKIKIRLVKESKKTLNESEKTHNGRIYLEEDFSPWNPVIRLGKAFNIEESSQPTKKGTKVFRDVELFDLGNEYIMNVVATYEYTSDDPSESSESPSHSISKIEIRLEDVEKYEYKNNNWLPVLDEEQIVAMKTKVQEERMDEFKEEILNSFDSNDNDIV